MAVKLEASLNHLVDTRQIPNVFGHTSPEANAPALAEHVYLWTASFTKLLTSIAIMQLVEQSHLSLDEVVDAILRELGNLQVMIKTHPIITKNKMTYRHLLTRTSGLGYDFMHPYLSA